MLLIGSPDQFSVNKIETFFLYPFFRNPLILFGFKLCPRTFEPQLAHHILKRCELLLLDD